MRHNITRLRVVSEYFLLVKRYVTRHVIILHLILIIK